VKHVVGVSLVIWLGLGRGIVFPLAVGNVLYHVSKRMLAIETKLVCMLTLYRILSSGLGSSTVFSNAELTLSNLVVFCQLSKVPVTNTSSAGCSLLYAKL
jgi:hypothetical protein